MKTSAKILGGALVALLALTVFAWSAALSADHRGVLIVSFLSVGKGSAAFITAPSGRKVLIDGGPGTSGVRSLASQLPWWDRSIDIVLSTSPERGASVGLVDILSRYHVTRVIASGVGGIDSYARSLESAIADARGEGSETLTAKRGQVLDLGGSAYMEVLSPDRSATSLGASDGCVVSRLVYGETSFMFPCSASASLQEYLAYLDGTKVRSDVLLVPKSGGNGALSEIFLGYVSPAYAVVSRACDTELAQGTRELLARFEVQLQDTCSGTVTFVSDGASVRPK